MHNSQIHPLAPITSNSMRPWSKEGMNSSQPPRPAGELTANRPNNAAKNHHQDHIIQDPPKIRGTPLPGPEASARYLLYPPPERGAVRYYSTPRGWLLLWLGWEPDGSESSLGLGKSPRTLGLVGLLGSQTSHDGVSSPPSRRHVPVRPSAVRYCLLL